MRAAWYRLATVIAGAALVVAGTLTAQPVLVTAGVGVLAWSAPHPADSREKVLNGRNPAAADVDASRPPQGR